MKKKTVISLCFIFLFVVTSCAVAWVAYRDVYAIQHITVGITNVSVGQLLPEITLIVDLALVNDENSRIRMFQGDFDIFVLNQSVGHAEFDKVNINARSVQHTEMILNISYENVTYGVIDVLKEMTFSMRLEGTANGRILWGLHSYHKRVTALWNPLI